MGFRKVLILGLAAVLIMALGTYAGVTTSLFTDDEPSSNNPLGVRWGEFTINDGFESTPWDQAWDENGTTSWIRVTNYKYAGAYSAYSAQAYKGYLTSDEIEASTADNITISFRYRLSSIETGDVFIQTYNGTAFNNWWDIRSYSTYIACNAGTWCYFNEVITDTQYLFAGFRFRFDSNAINASNDKIWVDNVVITTDTTPPSNPTGLAATGGSEQISLNWNDNSDPDLLSYNVYRGTAGGGPYSLVNTEPVYSSAYTDTPLYGGGTYYYVVRAVDYGNNESGNSNEDDATAVNVAPANPTGLIAAAGAEEIALTWTANSETDVSGYNIFRSTVNGGPYSQVAGPIASTNYTDTGLYGGGLYYYVVRAVDTGSLESGNSNQDGATATNAAPAAPTGLAATPGNELIALDWSDNAETDFSTYSVYRSVSGGGPYTLIAGSIVTSNYTDTPLYGGGAFYYVVRAVDTGALVSSDSAEANATAVNVAPATPTGLAATPGAELITLDWDDNAETDLAGYNIFRATVSGGPYTQINGSPVAVSNYSDVALYGGGTYYYVVRAEDNGALESGNSAQASATATNAAPAAPTNLVATGGAEQITLDWDDNGETDFSSYRVYRSASGGGPYTLLASSIVTSNYTDTPLYGGGTYYYVVRAVDTGTLESGNSNEDDATAANAAPAAPTGLNATAGAEQIALDWNDNIETDLTGYNVYRGVSGGGPYAQINGVLLTSSNYTDTPLYGGGTFYYVVTAVDTGALESDDSSEDSAVATNAAPATPINLIATDGEGFIQLDWTPNTEDDLGGYNIYRGTTSGNYTVLEMVWNTANYTDYGAVIGVTYYYVVTAVDTGALQSAYSNEDYGMAINGPPNAPTGLTAVRGNQKINLFWNDNTEPDLAGYNVYRGATGGGPYTQLNLSLVGSSYEDTTVTANITYYYVVTAEDLTALESGYSNEDNASAWVAATWTVTTQGEFESGIVSANLTTSLSSGDVKLLGGGNAGGANMILLWDGGSAPSGWSIVSDTGGDFYQKFIRGAATYGGTGGSATHTHNVSQVSVSAPSVTRTVRNGSNLRASTTHAHTLTSGSTSAESNLPSYRNLQVIKYNSGTPATIPTGAIAIFDSALPSGWTQYAAQDNYFVRAEGAAGSTGGSDTHTHSVNISLGASSGTQGVTVNTNNTVPTDGHTHTGSGNTVSGDNRPPYITVILAEADSDTGIPVGMIAMFDATPTGNWDVVSGSGDAFESRFIVGSSGYGTTGGSATTTHSNLTITTGGPSANANTRTTSANANAASNAHTHNVTVSFDSPNTLPPYIDVIFAKAIYYASGAIASSVLDTAFATSEWAELSWASTLPSGTSITFEVRASDSSFTAADTNLAWTAVGGASPVTSSLPSGRYKQWRATLNANGTRTSAPTLHEVVVSYQDI